LAGYISAYLALLFACVPIIYMGLNMLTCPTIDSIDTIWDTRSNSCVADPSVCSDSRGLCASGCAVTASSIPTICDEDVKLVNLRVRHRLRNQGKA
jgi:hypothetical protein